jgi:hypothetical protein
MASDQQDLAHIILLSPHDLLNTSVTRHISTPTDSTHHGTSKEHTRHGKNPEQNDKEYLPALVHQKDLKWHTCCVNSDILVNCVRRFRLSHKSRHRALLTNADNKSEFDVNAIPQGYRDTSSRTFVS